MLSQIMKIIGNFSTAKNLAEFTNFVSFETGDFKIVSSIRNIVVISIMRKCDVTRKFLPHP